VKRAVCFLVICVSGWCFGCGRGLAAEDSAKDHQETVYDIGGDVQPPKLIHVEEPSFDPKSEEAFTSGVVRIQIIVTQQGSVRDPKVVSGLNERQDKKAVEAVQHWRFKPATRRGDPVSVRATVEVNFHLL
jgi:protein TonB